jgi:hypothetical protein
MDYSDRDFGDGAMQPMQQIPGGFEHYIDQNPQH